MPASAFPPASAHLPMYGERAPGMLGRAPRLPQASKAPANVVGAFPCNTREPARRARKPARLPGRSGRGRAGSGSGRMRLLLRRAGTRSGGAGGAPGCSHSASLPFPSGRIRGCRAPRPAPRSSLPRSGRLRRPRAVRPGACTSGSTRATRRRAATPWAAAVGEPHSGGEVAAFGVQPRRRLAQPGEFGRGTGSRQSQQMRVKEAGGTVHRCQVPVVQAAKRPLAVRGGFAPRLARRRSGEEGRGSGIGPARVQPGARRRAGPAGRARAASRLRPARPRPRRRSPCREPNSATGTPAGRRRAGRRRTGRRRPAPRSARRPAPRGRRAGCPRAVPRRTPRCRSRAGRRGWPRRSAARAGGGRTPRRTRRPPPVRPERARGRGRLRAVRRIRRG